MAEPEDGNAVTVDSRSGDRAGEPDPATPPARAALLHEERAELQRVLTSGFFDRSPILLKLLNHLCERYFSGLGHLIKEYTIAVEAFHRSPDFDSRQDPIVRVNVTRLREALARFYQRAGRAHPLQITIPPGQYVPVFKTLYPFPPGTGLGRESSVLPGVAQIPVEIADSGIRFLAGYGGHPLVDRLGRVWSPDAHFEGGSGRALPVTPLTEGLPVYQTRREGQFSYHIPLAAGTYELRLHFIETDTGVGESNRIVDVLLDDRPLLREFDIVTNAGGQGLPDVVVFTGISPAADGFLHLRFVPRKSAALLSGIEILPGLPNRMRPLRLTAMPVCFLSADQVLWQPDQFSRGGQAVERWNTVSGSLDPGLFHAERFGNFRYALPVAPGRYDLRLFFAETFFGPSNPGGGGAGSRRFDVFCNGEALLRGLDVFEATAGENRALTRAFCGLTPNAQGKLNLDFVPVRNLATVSAIEVLPTEDAGPGSSR